MNRAATITYTIIQANAQLCHAVPLMNPSNRTTKAQPLRQRKTSFRELSAANPLRHKAKGKYKFLKPLRVLALSGAAVATVFGIFSLIFYFGNWHRLG